MNSKRYGVGKRTKEQIYIGNRLSHKSQLPSLIKNPFLSRVFIPAALLAALPPLAPHCLRRLRHSHTDQPEEEEEQEVTISSEVRRSQASEEEAEIRRNGRETERSLTPCRRCPGWRSGSSTTRIPRTPWLPGTRTSSTICRTGTSSQSWSRRTFSSGSKIAGQNANEWTRSSRDVSRN